MKKIKITGKTNLLILAKAIKSLFYFFTILLN